MLVVGPNPTFMEYVSHVLPTLGEESVEQRAVGELVDGVEATAVDPPEVERLKGDVRLAEVHRARRRAALGRRARRSSSRGWRASTSASASARSRELLERARERARADGAGARAVPDGRPAPLLRGLRRAARRARVARLRRGRALARREGVPRRAGSTASGRPTDPDGLVRSLLTAPRTARGGGGRGSSTTGRAAPPSPPEGGVRVERPRRRRSSTRRARCWRSAPRAFGHVIVDEAQDLTPMQLRMVARRARAGLGDDPRRHRAGDRPGRPRRLGRGARAPRRGGEAAEIAELRHAYRVPAEIMDLALPLLDVVAPGRGAPVAFRSGAAPPRIERVAEHELVTRRAARGARAGRRGGAPRGDPPGRARTRARRALGLRRRHPAALPAPREGPRVRPRRRRRAER